MKARLTYRSGDSLLHRLHPLVKAAWLLIGTVSVFVLRDPWMVLGLLAVIVAAFPLNRLSLGNARGVRLFVMTALVLALLQFIFVDTGSTWAELGPVTLTRDGVEAGIYVAGRFLCVVLLSYLFVLTTEPNDLAYALMKAGLPYRYGFALITALRLVPVFEDEGQIVYEAQLARGLRYDTGGPARYLRLARQYVLPLLISALGKVDALAVSMEGRCFGKYPRRTFLREVKMTRADVVALVVLGVCIVGFILA